MRKRLGRVIEVELKIRRLRTQKKDVKKEKHKEILLESMICTYFEILTGKKDRRKINRDRQTNR